MDKQDYWIHTRQVVEKFDLHDIAHLNCEKHLAMVANKWETEIRFITLELSTLAESHSAMANPTAH